MHEIGASRLRQLKAVGGNGFVQRELENFDLELVIVLGAPYMDVAGETHLRTCRRASGRGCGNGLPIRIRNVGLQLPSCPKQLDARDTQVGAAVPYFSGDLEFSRFRPA